jgi:membrane protein involved in colicin uptake
MTEDAKTEETQAAATVVEKTPEELAAEAEAKAAKDAKQKAKKEAAAAQKAAKEAKKKERLEARQAADAAKNVFVKDPNDPCADKFGDLPLNRSQCDPETRFTKQYTKIEQLDASKAD